MKSVAGLSHKWIDHETNQLWQYAYKSRFPPTVQSNQTWVIVWGKNLKTIFPFRGVGLFIGIELSKDKESKIPATEEAKLIADK